MVNLFQPGPSTLGLLGPKEVAEGPRDINEINNIFRIFTNISRIFNNISRTLTNISRKVSCKALCDKKRFKNHDRSV